MRLTSLLLVCVTVLIAACDPSVRCAKQIEDTQSEINAARDQTTDVDKVNRIVEAAQHLSSAEHRRVSAEFDACFAEVEKAKVILAREMASSL